MASGSALGAIGALGVEQSARVAVDVEVGVVAGVIAIKGLVGVGRASATPCGEAEQSNSTEGCRIEVEVAPKGTSAEPTDDGNASSGCSGTFELEARRGKVASTDAKTSKEFATSKVSTASGIRRSAANRSAASSAGLLSLASTGSSTPLRNL